MLHLLLAEIPSHLDDLPPTMIRKDYANVPIIDRYDTGKGNDGSLERTQPHYVEAVTCSVIN